MSMHTLRISECFLKRKILSSKGRHISHFVLVQNELLDNLYFMDSRCIHLFLTCKAQSAAVFPQQFTSYPITQSNNDYADVEVNHHWSLLTVYEVTNLRWVEQYQDTVPTLPVAADYSGTLRDILLAVSV